MFRFAALLFCLLSPDRIDSMKNLRSDLSIFEFSTNALVKSFSSWSVIFSSL